MIPVQPNEAIILSKAMIKEQPNQTIILSKAMVEEQPNQTIILSKDLEVCQGVAIFAAFFVAIFLRVIEWLSHRDK